jgi:hypothetical protein
MKAGRPAHHVRSKWLTVLRKDVILYFELDKKGILVSMLCKNDITPHHIAGSKAPAAAPPGTPQAEQAPQIPIQSPPPVVALNPSAPTDDFLDFKWDMFTETTEYHDFYDFP